LGRWYIWGQSDYDAGLVEHKRAFALDPHQTEAVLGIAGIAQRGGRTSESADFLNKALEVDPRNLQLLRSLSATYSMGREYTRAREVAAQTLAINSSDETDASNLSDSIFKETGDVQAAERVIDSYLESLPPEKRKTSGILEQKCHLLWFSRDFVGLQKLFERMPAEAWSNAWSRLEFIGAVHEELGDKQAARNFYQQARLSVLPEIAKDPNEPSKHAMLALLDADLGLADEALAESHKAADLEPLAKNAMDGAQWAVFVPLVNARLGRIDESIKLLQELLSTPGTGDALPPWYLRLDPFWDSLRADPRFKKLIASS
jgi:tetratricopeptide (TPR) repeat protein